MVKKLSVFLMISLFLLTSGCALSKSIRARTLLQNCSFGLKRIDLSIMDFAPFIRFDGKNEKVSIENPPIRELIELIPQITKGEFSLDFSKLTLLPQLAIDNPNDQEVILDSMFFDVFLDDSFLMNAAHNKRVTIPAKKSGDVTITLNIPTEIPFNKLIEGQQVRLKGKAFLKLNITPSKSVTLPIPVDISQNIPRDKIYEKLEEEKNHAIKKLLESIKNGGAKSIIDSFF